MVFKFENIKVIHGIEETYDSFKVKKERLKESKKSKPREIKAIEKKLKQEHKRRIIDAHDTKELLKTPAGSKASSPYDEIEVNLPSASEA